MTCRTKGPRRALQHPECGRQIEDKWETNEYDVWNQGAQTSITASRMWETSGRQMSMTCRTKGPRRALQHPECGRQMGDKWETNEYDV